MQNVPLLLRLNDVLSVKTLAKRPRNGALNRYSALLRGRLAKHHCIVC